MGQADREEETHESAQHDCTHLALHREEHNVSPLSAKRHRLGCQKGAVGGPCPSRPFPQRDRFGLGNVVVYED